MPGQQADDAASVGDLVDDEGGDDSAPEEGSSEAL
jgi:hypothetical protein